MFAFVFDNVSFGEWTVLLVVFLIVMGPRKIPQTARTLGNYYSKLRRAAESFKRQLMDMETELNKAAEEIGSEVKDVEGAFTSEGDESEAIPPQDAYYYPPDIDAVENSESTDASTEAPKDGASTDPTVDSSSEEPSASKGESKDANLS